MKKPKKDYDLPNKINYFISLAENNFHRNLKKYLFEIWRLRTLLVRAQRKEIKEISHKKNRSLSLLEPSYQKEGEIKNFEYIGFTTGGLVGLLEFLREAINNIIFELFVRSINHANQRKLYIQKIKLLIRLKIANKKIIFIFDGFFIRNSLILFILNLKELKEKYWKGLSLALETYYR